MNNGEEMTYRIPNFVLSDTSSTSVVSQALVFSAFPSGIPLNCHPDLSKRNKLANFSNCSVVLQTVSGFLMYWTLVHFIFVASNQ